jgi:hypothetical protein
MANYFVDSTTGDDGDSGLTMDLAWATLEYAMESGGLSAGDIVWIRRIHAETPTSDINIGYGGTPENPIHVIGWPRNTDSSITSATWTNGSTTVDLIVGLSMDREKHLGRYITAPDGFDYFITKIDDSNTITIDREYAGSTVSGASGACTIKADEDYALAQAIDDSGWTITKTTWNADADDLPAIDFGDGSYQFAWNQDYCWYLANIEFRDSTDPNGIIWFREMKTMVIRGCLFHNDNNAPCLLLYGTRVFIHRTVFTGGRAGSPGISNNGLLPAYSYNYLKDVAIYGFDGYGISFGTNGASIFAEGLNVGVEDQNDFADISTQRGVVYIIGRDIKIGGSGSQGAFYHAQGSDVRIQIENYQRVLGNHFEKNLQGTITKTDVTEGSGDPEKRSGGSDSVIEILYDHSDTAAYLPSVAEESAWVPVFTHEFEVDDTPKNYRYYVQAEGAVAADELWIELEYVSSYDDTSEYTITRVVSVEAISARSGADDWSQFLEINNITPAVASKVRIKCYCRYYHATNKIYIDPQVRVS